MQVLLAVDGTAASAKAASFLERLLGGRPHEVTTLSVAEVSLPFAVAPPGTSLAVAPVAPFVGSDATVTRLGRLFEDAEARAAERAAASAPAGGEVEVGSGDPAAEILRVADEIDADLIVVGSHERGLVDRLLHGSVSATVARRADRPVLLVR